MNSITGIDPANLNSEKAIKMNGKLDAIMKRELLKMYSEDNFLEYRFLSRFYSQVAHQVDLYLVGGTNYD